MGMHDFRFQARQNQQWQVCVRVWFCLIHRFDFVTNGRLKDGYHTEYFCNSYDRVSPRKLFHHQSELFIFIFGTTTVAGKALPVPVPLMSLVFSDLLITHRR